VISSVSDRDPAALRELERLGLKPGARLYVGAGTRTASLLVRIGGNVELARLSQKLARAISVVADPEARP
jgi:hypothetical protein